MWAPSGALTLAQGVRLGLGFRAPIMENQMENEKESGKVCFTGMNVCVCTG